MRTGVGTSQLFEPQGCAPWEGFPPGHPGNTVAYAENLGASVGYLIVFTSLKVTVLCHLSRNKTEQNENQLSSSALWLRSSELTRDPGGRVRLQMDTCQTCRRWPCSCTKEGSAFGLPGVRAARFGEIQCRKCGWSPKRSPRPCPSGRVERNTAEIPRWPWVFLWSA